MSEFRRSQGHSWIFDPLTETTSLAFINTHTLFQKCSEYQQVEIFENPYMGRVLMLDHELQSASNDEFIYHEVLVHPAMLLHPKPKHVAILGGGEGATLREVLKHESVERVTMIDIDGLVVEASKKHLPSYSSGAFENPKTELIIGDAKKWIEEYQGPKLDVIISDLTEPKPSDLSGSLLTVDFFHTIQSQLSQDGILSLQSSRGTYQQLEAHCIIVERLKKVFPNVTPGSCLIPSFACNWTFTLAGRSVEPLKNPDIIDTTIQSRNLVDKLHYLDKESYHRMYLLPKYHRDALKTKSIAQVT